MITMSHKEQLTCALHSLLLEKTLQSDKVQQLFQQICQTYSFDAGAVYDVNRHDDFIRQEFHNNSDTPLCEQFFLEDISKSFYQTLAHEPITAINRSAIAQESQQTLLDTFQAASLIFVSMVDSNFCIYSLLVFIRFDKDMPCEDDFIQEITLPLTIFAKHLSIRSFENKFSYTKSALENILDNTGIDIYAIDFYTHDILYVNKSMAEPYGGLDKFTGRKCYDVLFPQQGGQCDFCPQKYLVDDLHNPKNVYSWDYQRAFDGSWFRVFSAAFPWGDGRLAHVVSSVDITENKQNEALIQYMANYDTLTKLPNRRKLVNECEARIVNGQETNGYVLFFDIDKFKYINDNFGHESGDEFLIQLGEFFSNIPMLKDSIYRNGGDEFVALLDDDINEAQVRNLARHIHQRFQKPWNLKKGTIYCNVSIGVACYPQDGASAEVLINKADQAMYKVKEAGGGSIFFASDLRKANK